MLIDEGENVASGRKVAQLQKLPVVRIVHVGARAREFPGVSHHGIERKTPGASRPAGLLLDGAENRIARALKDGRIARDVGTEGGVRIEQEVGVIRIEFPAQDAIGPIDGLVSRELLFDFGRAEIVGEAVGVFMGIEQPGQSQLLGIVDADDPLASGFRLRQRRQQHRRQQAYDRDNHQQLDQGETGARESGKRPGSSLVWILHPSDTLIEKIGIATCICPGLTVNMRRVSGQFRSSSVKQHAPAFPHQVA